MATTFGSVRLETASGMATITLDRPPLNVLTTRRGFTRR